MKKFIGIILILVIIGVGIYGFISLGNLFDKKSSEAIHTTKDQVDDYKKQIDTYNKKVEEKNSEVEKILE